MCENNCDVVNVNEGTSVAPSKLNVTVDAKSFDLLKQLIQEREEFDKQLQHEKAETERFRQLYLTGLGYIYKAIQENNTGILNEAITKFAELESDYTKK